MEIDREARDNASAARKIFELNQLKVAQVDGIVRKADGTVVGRQKWLVNVDYSLDTKESEDFVVNAASEEEANMKVDELLMGVAKRKGYVLGSVFVNFAAPKVRIDG
tara:strand:+ start:1077 stop:1397 length:321 start_codon:yes stop_codon:yes gene_type:complete